MNKYQEALDRLESITNVPSMFINETVKELVDTFQELVDRATPKKPKKRIANIKLFGKEIEKRQYLVCPNECNKDRVVRNDCEDIYCSRCGQKLDWSKDE